MNRRPAFSLTFFLTFLLIFFLFLPPHFAQAEDLAFTIAPGVIYPGKMERISFTSSVPGTAVFSLTDPAGNAVLTIRDSLAVSAGENHLTWDGTDSSGDPVPPGDWALSLSLSETEITVPITIGRVQRGVRGGLAVYRGGQRGGHADDARPKRK